MMKRMNMNIVKRPDRWLPGRLPHLYLYQCKPSTKLKSNLTDVLRSHLKPDPSRVSRKP